MKEVRAYIERLRSLKQRDVPPIYTYRLIVSAQARFAVNSIVRTEPILPLQRTERAGTLPEVNYLLQWVDVPNALQGNVIAANNLGVDFAAILGLSTGRKVAFANEFSVRRQGANQLAFIPIGVSLDSELYAPITTAVEERTSAIIQAICELPLVKAEALGGSIRMRNAACGLVDSDHSTAYGLLVMAVEALSGRFGSAPNTWEDWDKASEWNKLFAENSFDEGQRQAIRAALIGDKQVRLRRTFIEYAANGLDDSFWSSHYQSYAPVIEITQQGARWMDETGKVEDMGAMTEIVPDGPAILRKRLGKSYDARSVVVHHGARIDQIVSMRRGVSAPGDPLPFHVLRRILDHLLWGEIERGSEGALELPIGKFIGKPGTAAG